MKVYLHGDNAEGSARYVVTIAPAADTKFVSGEMPKDWTNADGSAKQIEIMFAFGAAEVADADGKYMVDRGIAHKHRMLRKVRQLFDRFGKPIEEVFDERGARIFLEGQAS
jgi:hypothetical protein